MSAFPLTFYQLPDDSQTQKKIKRGDKKGTVVDHPNIRANMFDAAVPNIGVETAE